MLSTLYSIGSTALIFIIILSIVVFIHEFGHYIVAKWCGVKVETFSIGFGPKVFACRDKSGTEWRVSIVPLGGYVKMFGDADPASTPEEEKLEAISTEEKRQAFFFQPLRNKIAIVAAGPLFNYLLAIVIFAFLFFAFGKISIKPEISRIQDNSPAQEADLRPGDIVKSIEGHKVDSFQDIQEYISLNTGTEVELFIEREGEILKIFITPELREVKDGVGNLVAMPFIGISAEKLEYKELGVFGSLYNACAQSISLSANMLKAIGQIVAGERSFKELGGPIKIAQYSGYSVKQGMISGLWFVALISINLGLVNLLPIPMLDGGHLAVYIFEALTGRTVSVGIQDALFKVGFVILMLLMIFVTFNDLIGLFK